MAAKKSAALDHTPVTITGRPKPAPAPKAKTAKPWKSMAKTPPEKFTYALKDYTADPLYGLKPATRLKAKLVKQT